MHAVVLLYNYYHRKQYPKLEVLRFSSFCKLVVDLKPALLAHMTFMQMPSDTELDDLEKQLSVTERTIMDACEISTSLDASMGAPNTEGWPISKVTVLLVDSKKENCFLQFGSITQGVWSVIDKNLEVRDHSSNDTRELTHINKKKRFTGNSSRGELRIDETSCQKLAYSAITEATGNQFSYTLRGVNLTEGIMLPIDVVNSSLSVLPFVLLQAWDCHPLSYVVLLS